MEQETIKPRNGEPLTGEDALRLTYRLVRVVDSDIFFAQMLIRYGTPEDVAALEGYIELTNHLRAHMEDEASDAQLKQHKYLKDVSQSMLRASRPKVRAMEPEAKIDRMFTVKALRSQQEADKEKSWKADIRPKKI